MVFVLSVGSGSFRRISMSLRGCLCRLNQHRPQPQSKMPSRLCLRGCCCLLVLLVVGHCGLSLSGLFEVRNCRLWCGVSVISWTAQASEPSESEDDEDKARFVCPFRVFWILHRKLLGGMSRSRLPLRRPPTRSKMPPRPPSVLLVCASAV